MRRDTMAFLLPSTETKNWNSGISNVVCKLSRMIRIIPIKANIAVLEIAMKFKQLIYRDHGLLSKTISDHNSRFMRKFWKSLFKSLVSKLAPSSSYHLQTDSQSEIANWNVEGMIRIFANYKKSNWDMHLIDFEVAHNSAINGTAVCS